MTSANQGGGPQDVAELAGCKKSLLIQVQGLGDVLCETVPELKLTQGNFNKFRQTTEAQNSVKQGLIDAMTVDLRRCASNINFNTTSWMRSSSSFRVGRMKKLHVSRTS